MKYTHLELVQKILSSLDSDEVNSISDTVESRQVSEIVETAYFNMMARADFPKHKQLVHLEASGSPSQPVLMYRPDELNSIEWVKYDKSEDADQQFEYVTILPVQEFLDYVHSFNPDDEDVSTFTVDGFEFYYRDSIHPTCCTIIEDYYIIFDSYDSDVDGTLQASKSIAHGTVTPVYTQSDTFTPDLNEQQFPLLLNEAKALAFLELKQIMHDKAERELVRQWNSLQKSKHVVAQDQLDRLPNYGRR